MRTAFLKERRNQSEKCKIDAEQSERRKGVI